MTVQSPKMIGSDWLTTAEAAALSGYSIEYLRRLLRRGELPGRRFGPVWAISREALDAYLQESKQSSDGRRGPK
ncbi:MAG: helix-turn-helix domain-containing protein [Candidatus Promineifilaceae bacterium]